MFNKFYPTFYSKNTYEVDYENIYKLGYKTLLFDVDSTLVPHGKPADYKVIEFFNKLHNIGFNTVLISNNNEERVKPFADKVNSPYIFLANKPSKKGYLKGVSLFNSKTSESLFFGDQLFTDVYGANRSNIHSVLVCKIGKDKEIQIILKRIIETIVMFFYKNSNKYKEI